MLPLRRLSTVLFLFILILGPVSLSAHWPLDGVCISTAPYHQIYQVMVEDGSGGAIVIFLDDRYGNDDIFAQRVDRYGNVMWDPDGVPICTITGDQSSVDAVSDGAGGAVITWQDARGGPLDIYAQRIGPDGTRLWHVAGVSVCSAANNQSRPRIATDGSGGGIIFWNDTRDGRNDLYVRRVDSSGSTMWTVWGVAVYTGGDVLLHNHEIASDGMGGAFLVWVDSRNGNNDIFYNRASSDGVLSWGSGGLDVCDAASSQYSPVISTMGVDRVAVAWRDDRNYPASTDIYAKMFGTSVSWWGQGIKICADSTYVPDNISIMGDSENGITLSYRKYMGSERDVFVQRLNFFGELEWGPYGVNLSEAGVVEDLPSMVSDGEGGAIVAWKSNLTMGNFVKAQRIGSDGNPVWSPDGVKISQYPHSHYPYDLISDGAGGAISLWTDNTYDILNPFDLYVQHVDRHGVIASPEPLIQSVSDVPMDQGGKVELTWDASYLDPWPNQEIAYYSVWKSLSAASAAMLKESGIEYSALQDIGLDDEREPGMPSGIVIRRETVGASAYYWELIATQTAQYYEGYSKVVDTDFTSLPTLWAYSHYQVAAHAADPLAVWTSQPDSGYSLDNLAPAVPSGLAGEQEYSPEGMDLVWDSNPEQDLSHYVIYRGTDPSFIPSTANLLASAYDTMYFDGGWTWEPGYVYKVSAVDIHNNESGYALLLPGQVTGDDPPTPEYSDYLAQNFPNPFNPSTTIQFGINKTGHARLAIYDASGRLVNELINETLPAGDYSETWNGTNSSGKHVSSGVYFYRLDAGEFSTKRKMILLR